MKVFSARNVMGVMFNWGSKNILLMSIYSPPSEDINVTLQEIDSCLSIPHDGVILAGDFNAKSPIWGGTQEDDRGQSLAALAFSKGLAILNEETSPPTFDGSRGQSWIDVTLCDAPLIENIFKWQVDMEVTSSDHNSISFSLYASKHKARSNSIRRTKLEDLDLVTFRRLLHSSIGTWAPPSQLSSSEIDLVTDQLHETIITASRNSAVKKQQVTRKEPWWTMELEILRSDARRAQRKYYAARDERDRKYLRQKWKKVEAQYTWSLNQAKRNHWAEVCERVTPEEPFGTHFEVAKNPDRRHFQLCTTQKQDGRVTLSAEDTISALLDFHFPTDQEDDDLEHATIRQTSRLPPPTPDDPLFTQVEVEAAFKSLNNRKAPGPDGLHANIVKETYHANPCFFLSLFNNCLSAGHFPSRWKKAHVVMFHKQGKKETDPSSLRPICLLDFLGKALDKLITQRLFHHLLSRNILHHHQYGFTPGRNATEAILQLKSWIQSAREQEKHSVIVSLDNKSAFSRVWWPLVLHKLKSFNCPCNLFNVVSSFLSGRQVSMEYGPIVVARSYSIGCPQGSNSGPLLWLIIANNALQLQLGTDTNILAYADDFYLFAAATGKHIVKSKIHQALDRLETWSKRAKVEFAHDKTQLIPFGKKGKHRHPPYCSFAGRPIKLTRQMKILGVILDEGLNGLAHLDYTRGKITRILNRLTMARGRRGLSGKVLKVLYTRALERILLYAAPAWWAGTCRQKDRMSSIQRQVMLAITGAFRTTSTAALYVLSVLLLSALVCEKEVAVYKLNHRHQHVTFLGEEMTGPTRVFPK
ncbi:Retrovirus-related Pol polyprotein from type-1 retrotransposable element R1 [Araneus ventricosus]|uniref:Retrovirus-related Pol polyprotein from type-1 retrotransposable element R1 n=1 Tax=Araneus ventricosus TaxID=182803 RepID=A0A4Y2WCN8_ARAVE|nr:Retrovirus-related Pol polyprotein from type-1 retrotransposable element R1 [Araneus ventricosus]